MKLEHDKVVDDIVQYMNLYHVYKNDNKKANVRRLKNHIKQFYKDVKALHTELKRVEHENRVELSAMRRAQGLSPRGRTPPDVKKAQQEK